MIAVVETMTCQARHGASRHHPELMKMRGGREKANTRSSSW